MAGMTGDGGEGAETAGPVAQAEPLPAIPVSAGALIFDRAGRFRALPAITGHARHYK